MGGEIWFAGRSRGGFGGSRIWGGRRNFCFCGVRRKHFLFRCPFWCCNCCFSSHFISLFSFLRIILLLFDSHLASSEAIKNRILHNMQFIITCNDLATKYKVIRNIEVLPYKIIFYGIKRRNPI